MALILCAGYDWTFFACARNKKLKNIQNLTIFNNNFKIEEGSSSCCEILLGERTQQSRERAQQSITLCYKGIGNKMPLKACKLYARSFMHVIKVA